MTWHWRMPARPLSLTRSLRWPTASAHAPTSPRASATEPPPMPTRRGRSAPPPPAPPAVPTIEGNWLLYDEVGANFVTFDAKGSVVGYQPPELAPNISGCGSVKGDAMTFNATGFTSRGGQTDPAWDQGN